MEKSKREFLFFVAIWLERGRFIICKHFMDIMNGSYAQTHFPCKLWDAGEKGLTLSAFEWEKDRKTLIYGQVDYMYGEALYKPEMKEGNPIRLYSLDEITEIFCKLCRWCASLKKRPRCGRGSGIERFFPLVPRQKLILSARMAEPTARGCFAFLPTKE